MTAIGRDPKEFEYRRLERDMVAAISEGVVTEDEIRRTIPGLALVITEENRRLVIVREPKVRTWSFGRKGGKRP